MTDVLTSLSPQLSAQGIETTLDVPTQTRITADRDMLRRAVLNLVLNALDAMPHGGTLTLAVRSDGDETEIRVTDSGSGIAADVLPRLFEPFATGKDTGLGMGLLMSKRIVEEHGGTIVGRNRGGGGAEFVVRLPARAAEPAGAR